MVMKIMCDAKNRMKAIYKMYMSFSNESLSFKK